MDNVTSNIDGSLDNITVNHSIEVFTSAVGFLSFMENSVIVVFLFKLLNTIKTNIEQHEFIKQLLFVTGIDTLSSFTLFWLGIIRISNDGTALLCAIVTTLTTTFQSMSLSNFTCICTFRYHIARNVRVHGANRKSRFTLILLVANCIILFVSMTSFISTVEIRNISEGTFIACEYMSIVTKRVQHLMQITILVAIFVCTLLSDVMCLLTALRLNKEINVISDGPSTSAELSKTQLSGPNKNSSKLTQRRAINTLAVINLFFNLSVFPVIIIFGLRFCGVSMPKPAGRFGFVFMFVNSLFNPFIIVVRCRELRRILWQFLESFKVDFCKFN